MQMQPDGRVIQDDHSPNMRGMHEATRLLEGMQNGEISLEVGRCKLTPA